MGRHYAHLTLQERRVIFRMREAKVPVRLIAERLGKHVSTIYREVRRNWFAEMDPWFDGYYGEYAHETAQLRRRRRRKIEASRRLRDLVVDRLKAAWSPEQIAGRLCRDDADEKISHETIYRFVYSDAAIGLYRYLPSRRRKRRLRRARAPRGFAVGVENTIELRPDVIEERSRLGDWECDLVHFRKEFGQANLTTMVDRSTRYLVLKRNDSRHSGPIIDGMIGALAALPPSARKSATFDRGSEFAFHARLKTKLGVDSYFCKTQSPWQRGTNENTNGRLRRFLPRSTDISQVDDGALQAIARIMNATPRKCLGYAAPDEAFSRLATVENAS